MPPIVNDRVAWSVGMSPSEPCRKLKSDRDSVCVQDSGGPRETPVAYSGLIRANTVLCICCHRVSVSLKVGVIQRLLSLRSYKQRRTIAQGL